MVALCCYFARRVVGAGVQGGVENVPFRFLLVKSQKLILLLFWVFVISRFFYIYFFLCDWCCCYYDYGYDYDNYDYYSYYWLQLLLLLLITIMAFSLVWRFNNTKLYRCCYYILWHCSEPDRLNSVCLKQSDYHNYDKKGYTIKK